MKSNRFGLLQNLDSKNVGYLVHASKDRNRVSQEKSSLRPSKGKRIAGGKPESESDVVFAKIGAGLEFRSLRSFHSDSGDESGEVSAKYEDPDIENKSVDIVSDDMDRDDEAIETEDTSRPPLFQTFDEVVDLGKAGTVGNPEEGLLEQTQPGVNELVPGLAHKVFVDIPLKNMDPGMSEDKY
ncbi:hypothetical protein U1Q18_041097, partial [Sarracenia purpurea var. burkii]